MTIEFDTIAKALYLRLGSGKVADTIELADAVVADVDASGALLGIEFIRIDRFAPYVAAHPEQVTLPSQLTYVSVDRGKTWQVEAGAGDRSSAHDRRGRVAELNGIFLADLVAKPELVDRIVEGATVTLDLAVVWS